MSVINKMLRDLDARRTDGVLPELSREVRSAAMQGTASVGAVRRRSRRRWLLVPLGLVLAGALAWYGTSPTPASKPGPAAVVEASPPPPLAAVLPQSPASAPDAGAAVPVAEPSESAAPVPSRMAEPGATVPRASAQMRAAAVHKPESGPVARAGPEKQRSARADRASAERPVAAAAPATTPSAMPAAAPPSLPAPPAPRRQPAAQETLAQAQSLWAAGSHDAALALLREALALALALAEGAPDAAAQLPPLARELARMELALGRSGAALALLTRLEPQLAAHADLWAMRGNAAQRLGQHAESVQAYQRALQLRPGEPRWLLGAAVSLAALGQLESAAQYAEQARALGPVSAEVLAYLRQAGVPLR